MSGPLFFDSVTFSFVLFCKTSQEIGILFLWTKLQVPRRVSNMKRKGNKKELKSGIFSGSKTFQRFATISATLIPYVLQKGNFDV